MQPRRELGVRTRGRLGAQRLFVDPRGFLDVLQAEQAFAEDGQQLHAHLRGGVGALVQAAFGLQQQLRGRQRLALALHRVRFAEHRRDEFLDLLGACLLSQRHAGLPGRDTRAREHRDENGGGGAHRELVARHELAEAVPAAVRLREHRARIEIPLDVVEQGMGRGITIGGIFLERLEHHGVEIAAQPGGVRAPRAVARSRGFGLEDRLFQCAARIALQFVGPFAAQQFVEHHAERIDIRGDGERLAEDLFRRGVVGSQCAAGQLGEAGFPRLPSSSSFAMPKSSRRAWPSALTRMFAGLRSRCTTSLPCA